MKLFARLYLDEDVSVLVATLLRAHFGIIVASRCSPYEMARRLAVLLNALTADEIENQFSGIFIQRNCTYGVVCRA